MAWPSSNGVVHISEVILRRARLVLKWVTVRRYVTIHPGRLSLYPQQDGKRVPVMGQWAVLCGQEGNRRSAGVAPAMRDTLFGISTSGSMAQGREISTLALTTTINGVGLSTIFTGKTSYAYLSAQSV